MAAKKPAVKKVSIAKMRKFESAEDKGGKAAKSAHAKEQKYLFGKKGK